MTDSVKCRGCIAQIPASKPSGLCYFCERTRDLRNKPKGRYA